MRTDLVSRLPCASATMAVRWTSGVAANASVCGERLLTMCDVGERSGAYRRMLTADPSLRPAVARRMRISPQSRCFFAGPPRGLLRACPEVHEGMTIDVVAPA